MEEFDSGSALRAIIESSEREMDDVCKALNAMAVSPSAATLMVLVICRLIYTGVDRDFFLRSVSELWDHFAPIPKLGIRSDDNDA